MVHVGQHAVNIEYIQPGKPAQNGFVERFNRTYREEVLDAYLFSSLNEARRIPSNCISYIFRYLYWPNVPILSSRQMLNVVITTDFGIEIPNMLAISI